MLYFNFEDPICTINNSVAFLDQLLATAYEFRGGQIEILFLDEIQNIQGWEKWLRKIIDQKKYIELVSKITSSRGWRDARWDEENERKNRRCIHWDTLNDFFAKRDEVAARISSTGAEDIFETGSSIVGNRFNPWNDYPD